MSKTISEILSNLTLEEKVSMVSVKTAMPVAKDQMMDVMQALRETTVQAPVHIGDIILSDICGSDIVATKDIQ